ncbi:hypothetical protein A3770_02p13770 [Chloropicon primus]|uniref:HTH HARE-type domain-containing protein n=1 Tax=Chloropicon primus TaxID=1764295 RepID=A0A5B8MEM6_9CHLO|nr:hypothetical protein A3770_02p13770 [Chloropicon primus]|eukprot:QDZ18859.1 hypothetical protein A3770_02p13770 [Chloropicon primus]
MIAAARADDGGDDDKGGLSPGAMDMDVDGEYLASFVTGSTTIIEEESDSEEDSGGAGSSFQPEPEKVAMMRDNARPIKTRNGKRTLVAAIYLVLQDAGESLHTKEILGRIQAKKLYVFKRRDGSVSTDLRSMRRTVSSTCSRSPRFVRTARGTYAIAKKYLNGSNTQGAVSISPLRDVVYRVLQDAGGSLHVKEIFGRIRAKKLYVFRRKDGSVHTDPKRMRNAVSAACSRSPRVARTARGTYAIAKKYLNGFNTQDAVSTSPLRDAIYRVLQEVGGSLHYREIFARIRAKKLHVFRRKDGSVHTDPKRMLKTVSSTCAQSPFFVRTERGIYAIAKEYLNRSTADNLNKQNSNTTTNNNMKTTRSPSPSPYALDLREALESGLMTEEEYAEAVQEAQRYDSKSPEKKREIADYNEALRIIFADASLKLSDKEQCIVKREYLEEVGLCKAPRPPSSKRTRSRSKTATSIVKVKQEE